jgi:hypothetical protein
MKSDRNLARSSGDTMLWPAWDEWQQYFPGEPYRQTCPNLPVHYTVPEAAQN